ncbi:MAG: tyrosine-type recombinase/integrase [Solirubrobacteraceae bacterium]
MSADDLIYRFLDSRSISRKSRYCYVCILRRFETFVRKRTRAGRPLSTATLRAWLKEEARRRPMPTVMSRTTLIARYLDWRTATGGGPNPLSQLRAQYGRLVTPIVRALLDDDYESALERLRPLPAFGSHLGPLMREHIARMQSLGYRYEVWERDLRRFDRFLQRRPDLTGAALPTLLEAWRHESSGPRYLLLVQRCGRALSRALHRQDRATPILSIDVGLHRRVVREERRPYLFTEAEIERLFTAARTLQTPRAPLRPIALHAMLTLAYCAGLRLGEIASLTLGDLDLEGGLLEIRETKFFKSRRLPLRPSVLKVLSRYLRARAAAGAPTAPDAPLWWSAVRRKGYTYGVIDKLLMSVIRRAGLKPERGRRGPRPHDLRHAFAAHRMLQWYRSGVNPQMRLPYLATYLGHKDIHSTLVYLNMTPELLRQASERYRQHGVGALRASGERL